MLAVAEGVPKGILRALDAYIRNYLTDKMEYNHLKKKDYAATALSHSADNQQMVAQDHLRNVYGNEYIKHPPGLHTRAQEVVSQPPLWSSGRAPAVWMTWPPRAGETHN